MKLKLKIFDINNDNKNSNKANNAMAISDIYFLVYNIKINKVSTILKTGLRILRLQKKRVKIKININ